MAKSHEQIHTHKRTHPVLSHWYNIEKVRPSENSLKQIPDCLETEVRTTLSAKGPEETLDEGQLLYLDCVG